jgi:predicted secreted protein
MLSIGDDAAGKTLAARIGDTVELRLEENRTALFAWEVVADGAPACALVSDRFEAAGTVPGAAGEHIWRFEARRRGACEIALNYRRKWDETTPPARTYHVRLQVA